MKALLSTRASRAWLGVALVGLVIVVLVVALGLVPRLAAGQDVIDAAKPALTVAAMSPADDQVYVANPEYAPELLDLQSWGLEVINPDSPDPGFPYWENLSWENADKYQPDLILWDGRSFKPTSNAEWGKKQPTWFSIKAACILETLASLRERSLSETRPTFNRRPPGLKVSGVSVVPSRLVTRATTITSGIGGMPCGILTPAARFASSSCRSSSSNSPKVGSTETPVVKMSTSVSTLTAARVR